MKRKENLNSIKIPIKRGDAEDGDGDLSSDVQSNWCKSDPCERFVLTHNILYYSIHSALGATATTVASFADSFTFCDSFFLISFSISSSEMTETRFISFSDTFFAFVFSKLIDRQKRQRGQQAPVAGDGLWIIFFPFFIIFNAIAAADHHHYRHRHRRSWLSKNTLQNPLDPLGDLGGWSPFFILPVPFNAKLHVLRGIYSSTFTCVRFSTNYYAIFLPLLFPFSIP